MCNKNSLVKRQALKFFPLLTESMPAKHVVVNSVEILHENCFLAQL
jgi:hypothetical protein